MRRSFAPLLALVVAILSLIQLPSVQAQAIGTRAVSKEQIQALPKGVSIHQLDNGMQVLLIENPAMPMVGSNVIIRIGSAYETFSTSGMSHMLEHLLFSGTPTRTQKQLYDDVDRIGGYNNASTAEFYTNFMMVTPSDQIKKGMDIQADMLFNSTIPDENFQKEKGIVLEEISKSIANPQEQLERNTLLVLYDRSALSLSTLGTYSTIQSMSRQDVNSFYRNNYVPNNMILSVIGNFQTSTMLPLIREIYGKASPGVVMRDANPEWATGYQSAKIPSNSETAVFHRIYDGPDKVLQTFYPLTQRGSPEYFQLLTLVLENKKDEIQSSLKAEFPKTVKTVKFSNRLTHLSNYLEAVLVLENDADYAALVNTVSTKLARLSFKLPEETVRSEATKARTEFVKNIEKPHMFGIYYSDEMTRNGIEAVLESFNGNDFPKAAKELESLKLTTPSIVILQSPAAKKEKERAETTANVKLFRDEAAGRSLIVAQNEVSNLLAVHYLVKHKAFFESKYGKDASKILHECLDQRLKSDQNRKMSSQYGLTFTVNDNPFIPMDDIYLHPDFGYIRVEGLASDIPGAVKYLNGQLKQFSPTEGEFKKAVEKFKGIEVMLMGGDRSKKLFDEVYKSTLYEPERFARNPDSLTYEKLLAFTKEYFNPSNMLISVVSPADPDSANALFGQYKEVPPNDEPSAYTPTFLLPTQPITIEKAGKGERSYLFWGFMSQIDTKDVAALQALSLILSNDIVFDIREKQGMAYNMSAGVEVIKDKTLFFVSQGTRPQNIDKLVPQYPRFFTMGMLDSLTQEKLDKSINMYLGRMMFRRLSSINQAFYLGSSFYFFNDYTYDKRILEELKKVKVANVLDVAKKYMNVKNPIQLIVR